MNLVFEDINKLLNLYKEDDKITGGEDRICVSPFANRMNILKEGQRQIHNLENGQVEFSDERFFVKFYSRSRIPANIKYIIPVGTHEAPYLWSGEDGESIFNLIDPLYLQHLREGRAYIMFDSSLEGYHSDKFFDFAFSEANRLRIPIKNIIWCSGNSIIEEQARKWTEKTGKECINVFGYSHFQYDIGANIDFFNSKRQFIPTWEDQYEYKKRNLPYIKDYNFLNRKPRGHRVAMFNKLFHAGLIPNGLVSMNSWDKEEHGFIDGWHPDPVELEHSLEYTPMRWNNEDNIDNAQDKINRLNEYAMLNSWVTIVSEARFEDSEGTIFLSEKIFKPIACSHPFFVLGNKGTLKELKKLGYTTFDFLLNESYDELDNIERLEAIAYEIHSFQHMSNHLEWYKWLRPRLEHNRLVLKFNNYFKPPQGFHFINNLCTNLEEIK
jgi:hypothetical protein